MRTILSAIGLMIQDFINACLTCSVVGVIILLVVLLAGCGAGGGGGGSDSAPINPGQVEPSTEHVKYYGWFHGFTNHEFGNWLPHMTDHANIAQVGIDHVKDAIDHGLIPLVYVDPRSMFLSTDWQSRNYRPEAWQHIINRLRPYEDVLEIYVADEPYGWSGNERMSHEDFEWVVNMWRKAFPDSVLWTDFLNIEYVPDELDIILLTPDYNEEEASEYRAKINRIYKKMHSGQEFVICTPAFLYKHGHSQKKLQWRAATVAEFLDIMLYDRRVVGALHFLPMTIKDGTGAEDMPRTVTEIKNFYHEEINR